MEDMCKVIAGDPLGEDDHEYYTTLCECRARLGEYGVRGMSVKDLTDLFARTLESAGMSMRVVEGRDAARIELTCGGLTRRYDREGREPIRKMMENYFLLSTKPLSPGSERGFRLGTGRKECGLTPEERLERFRQAMTPFDDSMELRTRMFRNALSAVSEECALGFDIRQGIPVYYEAGLTPFSRIVRTYMTITDLTDGTVIWDDNSLVVEEGADAASMRAFRRVFEKAGVLPRMPVDGGRSILERWDASDPTFRLIGRSGRGRTGT